MDAIGILCVVSQPSTEPLHDRANQPCAARVLRPPSRLLHNEHQTLHYCWAAEMDSTSEI